jgi:hypothetical protein
MKRLRNFFRKSKAMKIDALKFGFAGGIISALCISLSTIVGMFGYYQIHNSMMREMYGMFGYGASWSGVFLGAIYGFIDGFFMVWFFALIYNWLIK